MIHFPHPAMVRDSASHDQLRDMLIALVPPTAQLVEQGWRPWASASFAGARHWFEFSGGTSSAADWAALNLTEREWQLAKGFVADAQLIANEPAAGQWRVELLLVDD